MDFLNMISWVKRLYDQMMQPVSSRYQITRMELDILLFLSNNPEYDTATDIVERRLLTKSHVSASLKSLEERGFLAKSLQGGNRKTVHLTVLPAAGAILRDGRAAQHAFFQTVFQGFTPEEEKRMETNIERVMKNVRSAFLGGMEDVL